MGRAFLKGLALVAATYVAFAAGGEAFRASRIVVWVATLAPGFAAFVVSRNAPDFKFLLGLSMAGVATLVGPVMESSAGWSGSPIDFPGIRGFFIMAEIMFLQSIVPVLAGALIGVWSSRHVADRIATQPEE